MDKAKKKTGIYWIKNNKNGKVYIGQSKDIELRINCHIKALNKDSHYNPKLQNSWNKYGENSFSWEILKECDEKELDYYEKYFIASFDSFCNGLNLTQGGKDISWRGSRWIYSLSKKAIADREKRRRSWAVNIYKHLTSG